MNSELQIEKTGKIADLSDRARQFHKYLDTSMKIVATSGIAALPKPEQMAIAARIWTYDAFSPDNDPYGERDFGAFEHGGNKIFWEIDYYNTDLTAGSEDPSDPAQTTRVLTIMLADEY